MTNLIFIRFRFDVTAHYEQAVGLTDDINCGSATQVDISHDSQFQVKLENRANAVQTVFKFPDEEQLVTLRLV